jgi:hypothetical protein
VLTYPFTPGDTGGNFVTYNKGSVINPKEPEAAPGTGFDSKRGLFPVLGITAQLELVTE